MAEFSHFIEAICLFVSQLSATSVREQIQLYWKCNFPKVKRSKSKLNLISIKRHFRCFLVSPE